MTYDELKRRTTRGDRDAATLLLPMAREARDQQVILTCWRLLHAARFSAWQALEASRRAVPDRRGASDTDLDTTQNVRSEVIARALVDGNQDRVGDDVVAARLIAIARTLLDAPDDAPWRNNLIADQKLGRELRAVLLANDDREALAALDQVRQLLDDTAVVDS